MTQIISTNQNLAYTHPHLVSEWHESNKAQPTEVTFGSQEVIIWKCPNPNHEPYKMSVYERVNAKFGCQICSGRKRTHKSFSIQLKERFPNIELLSTYIQSDKQIDCKCIICGREWNPIANNLLKTGCAKCKNKAK